MSSRPNLEAGLDRDVAKTRDFAASVPEHFDQRRSPPAMQSYIRPAQAVTNAEPVPEQEVVTPSPEIEKRVSEQELSRDFDMGT
jgi:hypothetical protein